jgi:polar amino acid transport system substrate-binding protein
MRVRVAYVEEPPFYSTGADGHATGSDIELAEVILRSIGASTIEFIPTSFGELLPGLEAARWDMNVPIFVTHERALRVAFSIPVWSLVDGLVIRSGNPKELTDYASFGPETDAILGVIPGQVQLESALAAGVPHAQLREFENQPAAIASLLAGEIDAFAATAVGNRSVVETHEGLEAVELAPLHTAPSGAFSFRKDNIELLGAVNTALRNYLGTGDHRSRVAVYGIGAAEIDGAIRDRT